MHIIRFCVDLYFFTIGTSVVDAVIVLSTPNANNELHSITVTCTIHHDSTADHCVVMAMANNGIHKIGNEIINS